MSATTMSFQDAFRNAINSGLKVFAGGRSQVSYAQLTPDEQNTVAGVVNRTADAIAKVSPVLANTVKSQIDVVMSAAAIVKGEMSEKPITFPGQPNTIAIVPIIPEFINYGTIQGSVAQTGYPKDSWEVTLTAGTPFYLLGSSTAGYSTSGTPNYRFALTILQDGLVEVGTTPKIDQFKMWTNVESKYTPYTAPIVYDEPIELGKSIYQYQTLGALFIDWNLQQYWAALPRASGTSSLRILGFAFAEYNVFGGGGNLWYV